MQQQLDLIQEYQITQISQKQIIQIFQTVKQTYPKFIIKLSVYRPRNIIIQSKIKRLQQRKQSQLSHQKDNTFNILKKQSKQNQLTYKISQNQQKSNNFKHSSRKLNSKNKKYPHSIEQYQNYHKKHVKTQFDQSETSQFKNVKKYIVSGFLQTQQNQNNLITNQNIHPNTGKQDQIQNQFLQTRFKIPHTQSQSFQNLGNQQENKQQLKLNTNFPKEQPSRNTLKKQTTKSITSNNIDKPEFKKLQTICRFYGTDTVISQRQTNSNLQSKQNQITQSKNNQSFSSFVMNNNNTLYLTDNEDLHQGLHLYESKHYHQAIQVFLHMFYQFLNIKQSINQIQLSSLNPLKKHIYQDLSLYQKRVLSNLTFYLGNCYFRIRQYLKALLFYEYQSTFEQAKQQKAQRYNNMGSCYAKINKEHMALKSYQKALSLYNVFPNIDKSNLLYNIANMYLNFGMYKEANQYFVLSIQQRKLKSPEKQQMLCKTYYYLAISQRHEGKIQLSLSNFILGKQISQTGKISQSLYQKILYQMAITYQLIKNYRKSLNFYQKIVEQILKKGQNKIELGQIYQRVSLIFKRLKCKEKYLYFKKKSLEQYRNKFKLKGVTQTEPNQVINKE